MSSEVSSLLGQYLLQGYTMLATHCPHCNTVLMRTRDKSKVICVYCDVLKKQQEEQQKDESSKDTEPAQQGDAIEAQESHNKTKESPGTAKRPGPQPYAKGEGKDELDESDTTEDDDDERGPTKRRGNRFAMKSPPTTGTERVRTDSTDSLRRKAMLDSPSIRNAGALSDSVRRRFEGRDLSPSKRYFETKLEMGTEASMPMYLQAESNPFAQGLATQQQYLQYSDHSGLGEQSHLLSAHHLHQQPDQHVSVTPALSDPQSRAAVNQVRFRGQVAVEALSSKLQQATELLERASSFQDTIEICQVISAIAQSISSLKPLLE